MIRIRTAAEADAAAIREIFAATYGDAYTYPEFYDVDSLRRMLLAEDNLMLVAEDDETGEVVGTASVMFEGGAYSDLVGEFGRLVVKPSAWGRKIGSRLLRERLRRVRDRLHVGIIEGRVTHPYSVDNALRHEFAGVGLLPMKIKMGEVREHVAFLARYFGPALELRRNHPRIVPEVFPLASAALTATGVEPDLVVDEHTPALPEGEALEIESLTDSGYSSLLRIERGRLERREIFGPMRLHYGFYRLRAKRSTYLVARRQGAIAAALGYIVDGEEGIARIFELIHTDASAARRLFAEVERRAVEEHRVAAIEVDVSAYAPRMQRTLVELGYLPVAYVPALAFHRVERLDLVKMMRLLVPLELDNISLSPEARATADLVLAGFERQQLRPRVAGLMERADLFEGLTSEQARRLAVATAPAAFEAGETIFAAGEACRGTYLVLGGEVSIEIPGAEVPVGAVGAGEALGEVSLLTGTPHSATARASTETETAVITRERFDELVRQRPDIGVVIFRNLARGLGEKLRRTDLRRP